MASTKLSLCILTGNIGTYSKQPASIETNDEVIQAYTDTPPIPCKVQNEYTCLLEGELTDFLPFSGDEKAQWLIDIAHDLCDPRFKRGSLWVLCSSDGQDHPVHPTDPLTPSTYEYWTSVVVQITKKSTREGKSRSKSWGDAETMLEALRGREDRCWITKRSKPLAAGHILPKRTGDSEAPLIYEEFTGDSAPAGMTALYPEFGILLDLNMEYWFDDYWIGFRRLSGNNGYTVHNFTEERISKHGRTWSDRVAPGWKDLHGQTITPPNPASPINPPPGLFRWHYLQGVIRKFSTTDYQNIENIAMYETSVLMKGDSDDEGTDSEADWPSAIFDRGRFAYAQAQLEAERMDAVARWIASV
ncbi:hypothetical protein FB446DRAFT_395440 [Lentinula raphanica]|nr:hypothetical protein FB446DRAFT_395440 [Lentinula raphanica]